MSYTWLYALKNTSYHGMSHHIRGLGVDAIGLTEIKNVFLHFQLKLNLKGFLIVPTIKNI